MFSACSKKRRHTVKIKKIVPNVVINFNFLVKLAVKLGLIDAASNCNFLHSKINIIKCMYYRKLCIETDKIQKFSQTCSVAH